MNQHVQELGPEHNQGLLDLTEACALEANHRLPWLGRSRFRIDRSPDYFAYLRTLPGHLTVLGNLDGKSVAGVISYFERQVSWQGETITVVYFADLKIHPNYRNSRVAFRLLKARRERVDVEMPAYAYMLEENEAALSLIRGRATFRHYTQSDRIHHLLLYTGLPRRCPRGYQAVNVEPPEEQIWNVHFLRWSQDRNLAPISAVPAISGERRMLVFRGDQPVAVGSLIDQSSVRRIVPLCFNIRDHAIRGIVNGLGSLMGWPGVAGVGEVFRRTYLGNVAYDPQYPKAVEALLVHALKVSREDRVPFCYLGVSERDPVFNRLARLRPAIRLHTVLMTTGFPSPPLLPTFVNLHEM